MKSIKFLFFSTGLLCALSLAIIILAGLRKLPNKNYTPMEMIPILMEIMPILLIIAAIGTLTFLTTLFGHVWYGHKSTGYPIYAIYGAIGPGAAFFLFDLTESYFTPAGISIGFVGIGIIIGAFNGIVSKFILNNFEGQQID